MTLPTTQQLLRELWLKAYKDGTLTINFPSEKLAKRQRFALYQAVKSVRDGKEYHEELLKALNSVKITLEGSALTVSRVDMDQAAKLIWEAVGQELSPEPSLPPEAPAPSSRLEALIKVSSEFSEEAGMELGKTPYYEKR